MVRILALCIAVLCASTAFATDWKTLADEAKVSAMVTKGWADNAAVVMQGRKSSCECDKASATNLKSLSEALCTPPCADCVAGHVHVTQANNYWGYGGTSEGEADTAYASAGGKIAAGDILYMMMQYQQACTEYEDADADYWTAKTKYTEARDRYTTSENQYEAAVIDYGKCDNIEL